MWPVDAPPLMLETWLDRVRGHEPRALPGRGHMRQAAVAAVLASGAPDEGARVLLIRRAQRDGDPWSGHMAFPGGRQEPSDADDRATAVRETAEEVGLDLAGHRRGRLSDVLAKTHRGVQPMVIVPHVFLAPEGQAATTSDEVDEVVWVPLRFFADPANRVTRGWRMGGVELRMPAYHWRGREVWGLTLAMLDELIAVGYGRPVPRPGERFKEVVRSMIDGGAR